MLVLFILLSCCSARFILVEGHALRLELGWAKRNKTAVVISHGKDCRATIAGVHQVMILRGPLILAVASGLEASSPGLSADFELASRLPYTVEARMCITLPKQ